MSVRVCVCVCAVCVCVCARARVCVHGVVHVFLYTHWHILGMCVCVRAHAQVCMYCRAEQLLFSFYYRFIHVYKDLIYQENIHRASKYVHATFQKSIDISSMNFWYTVKGLERSQHDTYSLCVCVCVCVCACVCARASLHLFLGRVTVFHSWMIQSFIHRL